MHEHWRIPIVWYSVAIMRAHKRDERPFVALGSPALLAYERQRITGAFVHRGAGRVDAFATVAQGPLQPAEGDLNGDGAIDGADLGILLTQWGFVHSSADLNGDGTTDAQDIATLLGAWGSCP